MRQSPFHNFHTARKLESYANNIALLPAYASSTIEIYPYQIAAARFALRSPYLKGCILCDEGSLGKTYEALLIATQRWYEGSNKLLLVLPSNLIKQWTDKLNHSFTLPYVVVDNNDSMEQESLVIVTYDFAVDHADKIKAQTWDLVIFDEADCLNKSHTGQNKTANVLKNMTDGAFRLLLTPTPITKDIMDIYGLIYFIDETVLPGADEFYKRYFRKPENYHELTEWVSRYAFRTLKSQVDEYVNFTNRVPYTVGYELTDAEKELYKKLDEYLALPNKAAYPQMQQYDLTLMFYHILSSSAQAFETMYERAMSIKKHEDVTAADKEIVSAIDYILDAYQNLSGIISEIDRKHSTYTKSSTDKIQYLMSADQTIKGKLVTLLKAYAGADSDEREQLGDMLEKNIQANRQNFFDAKSLYHKNIRSRRIDRTPLSIERNDAFANFTEGYLLEQIKNGYPIQRVRAYVDTLFADGVDSVSSENIVITNDADFILLILAVIRQNEPGMFYKVQMNEGRVERGGYYIPNMIIRKKEGKGHVE